MSLKILLTADVHLGMKFASYGEHASRLSEARFETLRKIVDIANSEKCHLLVVAGDLFDRLNVSDKDIVSAAQILSSFHGITAVLPGNHDFITPGGKLWSKFKQHSGDRLIILDESKTYPLKNLEIDAVLYAGPCDAKHSSGNRVSWITDAQKDTSVKYHIGVAHGSLAGVSPDADMKYFPMTVAELQSVKLDLWLLGHTDRLQYPVNPGKSDRIFFPGAPEPDGFENRLRGGVWILELADDKSVKAKPVQTGKYFFMHDSLEISSADQLRVGVSKYENSAYANCLLKLYVSGRIPQSDFSELHSVQAELAKNIFYLDFDTSNLKKQITMDMINTEFTPSSFPHILLSKLALDPNDYEALELAFDKIMEVKK